MARNWYVVHTHEYCENISALNLKKQDYPVFLPLVSEIRQHPRFVNRPSQVWRPLFPEYFFTEFDLETDGWRKICSTRGVKRLLGSSPESPTPVPSGGVEELMARLSAGDFEHKQIRVTFKPDDKVRVTTGPFQGMAGICLRSKGERIQVLLDLLGGRAVDVRSDLLSAA